MESARAGGIAALPELFDCVVTRRTFDGVCDDELCGLVKDDAPTMHEACVGAGGLEHVALAGGAPVVHADLGLILPTEGAGWNGLIAAVDADRVVGRAAAELVTLDGVG